MRLTKVSPKSGIIQDIRKSLDILFLKGYIAQDNEESDEDNEKDEDGENAVGEGETGRCDGKDGT